MTAPDAPNFRDLGGLPTADGRARVFAQPVKPVAEPELLGRIQKLLAS